MDKFTVENAMYFGPVKTEKIVDMTREALIELVVQLMNETEKQAERHRHELGVLSALRLGKRL